VRYGVFRAALIAAAIGWAASIFVAAWIASRPDHPPIPYAFSLGVYGLGSMICHQRPERSFHLLTAQLPVCARCTGIYLGAALVAVWPRPVPRALSPLTCVTIASLPTLATLGYEWIMRVTPSNLTRGLTGAILGVAVALVLFDAVRKRPEVN
jgi:uncharacterized membrane protein